MSSSIWVMSFKDGKEANSIPSSIVLKALGPFIRPIIDPRFEERWELVFPDGGGGDMDPVVEGQDRDVFIDHHSGLQLLDALYEIMSQTHTMLWWSGCDNLITADENIAEHLPPDYSAQR
jgi:hypothetical protein